MKYRKKPVVIEAKGPLGPINIKHIAGWCQGMENWNGGSIIIDTLEGKMVASPGDYIIRGVQGEFYPCKPEIFEQTYEAVDL